MGPRCSALAALATDRASTQQGATTVRAHRLENQVDAGSASPEFAADGPTRSACARRLHVHRRGRGAETCAARRSWVAFKQGECTQAMLMGDLVLLEARSARSSEASRRRIEQTALHNHLLHESPHVMYMHFGGSRHAGEARARGPHGLR